MILRLRSAFRCSRSPSSPAIGAKGDTARRGWPEQPLIVGKVREVLMVTVLEQEGLGRSTLRRPNHFMRVEHALQIFCPLTLCRAGSGDRDPVDQLLYPDENPINQQSVVGRDKDPGAACDHRGRGGRGAHPRRQGQHCSCGRRRLRTRMQVAGKRLWGSRPSPARLLPDANPSATVTGKAMAAVCSIAQRVPMLVGKTQWFARKGQVLPPFEVL